MRFAGRIRATDPGSVPSDDRLLPSPKPARPLHSGIGWTRHDEDGQDPPLRGVNGQCGSLLLCRLVES